MVKGNIKYIYKEDSLSKSDLNIFIKRFNITMPPLFGSSIIAEKPPVMALAKVRFFIRENKNIGK